MEESAFCCSSLNLQRATQNFVAFLSLLFPRPGATSSNCNSRIIMCKCDGSKFSLPLSSIGFRDVLSIEGLICGKKSRTEKLRS